MVRFVRGVDEAEVARQYAQAEVAVVPSLYEGFSIPALQAMACGVPLVATTAGALPEVAGANGETALLVPPGDAGGAGGGDRPPARRPGAAHTAQRGGAATLPGTFELGGDGARHRRRVPRGGPQPPTMTAS